METADRLLWKRHVDLLKEMESRVSSEFQEVTGDLDVAEPLVDSMPLAPPTPAAVPPAVPDVPAAEFPPEPQEPASTSESPGPRAPPVGTPDVPPATEPRYPTRERHRPDRFGW